MKYLNLGCGNSKLKNCINIDCRKECNPDLVYDIKNLPYKPNSVDGIYALDVLEHIPRNLVLKTLKSWHKILKLGSFLIIRLPNLKVISEKYLRREINNNEFSRLIYGGQEKNEFPNFHKSGFDKETLTELLKGIGFEGIENNIKVKCNSNNMVLKFGKVWLLR